MLVAHDAISRLGDEGMLVIIDSREVEARWRVTASTSCSTTAVEAKARVSSCQPLLDSLLTTDHYMYMYLFLLHPPVPICTLYSTGARERQRNVTAREIRWCPCDDGEPHQAPSVQCAAAQPAAGSGAGGGGNRAPRTQRGGAVGWRE